MANFYAVGHRDDGDRRYHVGRIRVFEGTVTFMWCMDRARLEEVMSGTAEKHCPTCTCGDEPKADAAVIEDDSGNKYSRRDFAGVLLNVDREERTMEGAEFR